MSFDEKLNNMDFRIWLVIIMIFLIISFSVIVVEFRRIDMVGVQCAKDPLKYAEKRMEEVLDQDYTCGCDPNPIRYYSPGDLNASWNPLNFS